MKHVKLLKSHRQSERGYNLLMTSMSLMVIGIIAVGLINIYAIYKKNDDVTTNQSRVTDIVSTIQNYKNIHGRFPCPSSLDAPRIAPAYGAENCGTVIPAGTCSGGLCVINGRTIAGVQQPVRIGSVPFRLLQIDEKETIDAYGSRFVYAVTESQTNVSTFNELNGAIDIVDESGQSIADPTGSNPGSVSFSIASNGPNKYGAFNLEGTQPVACSTGVNESANCINLISPPASPYKMLSSMTYLAGGATEFDDTIEYFSSSPPTRWRRTDGEVESIQTISNNNVGMGVSTPIFELDISQSIAQAAVNGKQATLTGALQAHTSLSADKICDYTGTHCFQTSDFTASPNPQMDCNSLISNRYMVGIEGDGNHAQARCDYVKTGCLSGQVLVGFEATGQPKCTTLGTSCPQSAVQICNGANPRVFDIKNSNAAPFSNPTNTSCINSALCSNTGKGVDGETYTIYDPNSYSLNYARAKFKCNAGNWEYLGGTANRSGLCSCNPVVPASSSCTTSPISTSCSKATGCEGYGSGTKIIPYTYSASSCGWTAGRPIHTACSCPTTPPVAPPSTSSCSSTGSNGTSWTWSSAPSVCNWQATCTCTAPSPSTKTLTAGVACNLPAPSGPGLIGYTGTAYRTQVFNAAVGTCRWVDSGWDTSGCTCDTSAPPFSEHTTSTCNSSCENETTPAYNWYVYKVVGGSCVKTLDHTTPSVCGAKTFSLKIDATQVPSRGQTSYGTIPPIGEHCNLSCTTNNTVGSGSSCWQAGDNAKYDIFSCVCLEN